MDSSLAARIDAFEDSRVSTDLDTQGWSTVERLLTRHECKALVDLYGTSRSFRSKVVLARHGFGRGEYQYFTYPLPDIVAALRTSIYPHLVPIANGWNEKMGIAVRYPDTHAAFLKRCHDAGQTRPTPLLLQYGQDDLMRTR